MTWTSREAFLTVVVITLFHFSTTTWAADPYIYSLHKMEWGFDNVMVFTGDTLDINCTIVHAPEGDDGDFNELDPNLLENVTMKFFFEKVPLPDYSTASDAEKEAAGVISYSPFWFRYKEANKTHRGTYTCNVTYDGLSGTGNFYARVKDKASPLWPGVGFAGEVLLLATILFIYEKSRNKDELEQEEDDADH